MYFWVNYCGFNGKICSIAKLRFLAGLPRSKCFNNGQFNPITNTQVVIYHSFKLTNSPAFFERRCVTSPDTLVSKGRHCYWDYHSLQSIHIWNIKGVKKVYSAVHRRIWKHVKQIIVANFVFSMHKSFLVMLYSVCNHFLLCMISQSYTFIGYCLSDALTKAAIFENVTFTTFEFFFQPGSLVNVPKGHIRRITSLFRLSTPIS